jgi:hypothetical protein
LGEEELDNDPGLEETSLEDALVESMLVLGGRSECEMLLSNVPGLGSAALRFLNSFWDLADPPSAAAGSPLPLALVTPPLLAFVAISSFLARHAGM